MASLLVYVSRGGRQTSSVIARNFSQGSMFLSPTMCGLFLYFSVFHIISHIVFSLANIQVSFRTQLMFIRKKVNKNYAYNHIKSKSELPITLVVSQSSFKDLTPIILTSKKRTVISLVTLSKLLLQIYLILPDHRKPKHHLPGNIRSLLV